MRALPRLRVLVIDDERLVGEAIARSLAEDNDVEVVTDAQQGLARIEAGQKYDVILCDLMMPVMTGMDLYAEIVRRAPQITGRIVFMTGRRLHGARAVVPRERRQPVPREAARHEQAPEHHREGRAGVKTPSAARGLPVGPCRRMEPGVPS